MKEYKFYKDLEEHEIKQVVSEHCDEIKRDVLDNIYSDGGYTQESIVREYIDVLTSFIGVYTPKELNRLYADVDNSNVPDVLKNYLLSIIKSAISHTKVWLEFEDDKNRPVFDVNNN